VSLPKEELCLCLFVSRQNLQVFIPRIEGEELVNGLEWLPHPFNDFFNDCVHLYLLYLYSCPVHLYVVLGDLNMLLKESVDMEC